MAGGAAKNDQRRLAEVAGLERDRALLGRASTAERVADILRDRITEGYVPPGARLSEESIGGALGVSRNTLREAFRPGGGALRRGDDRGHRRHRGGRAGR